MSKANLEVSMDKRKKKTKERDTHYLPEEITINILRRLPLQIIVRFKLVCREWKLVTESAFFSDLYQRNSNSNWSMLHGNYRWVDSSLEEMKLDLPVDSPHGSCYNLSFVSVLGQSKNEIREIRIVACSDGLVLLRVRSNDEHYYIGNPVLSQWIPLPPPPLRETKSKDDDFRDSGLVTRTQNGALLGYKVVRVSRSALWFGNSQTWSFEIFSSDTSEWSVEHVSCPGRCVLMFNTSNPVSLNGKLHWLDNSRRIIVRDFFSHDVELREISLPERMQDTEWDRFERRCNFGGCSSPCGKKICTTSQGYVVLIDVGLIDKFYSYNNVRVWKLKTDSWSWEKAWELNMASLGIGFKCVPMAINCFDIDIIYLWSLKRNCFIACNVRTNIKSRGTRKDGAANKDRKSLLVTILPKLHATRENGDVYKEDTFSFEPRSCISQFVPSLHLVPTLGR